MMGTEAMLLYVFTVRSAPIKSLWSVPAPPLPVSGPGTILCPPYCQMCHSWCISYLALQGKVALVLFLTMLVSSWNLFASKLDRSCLCSPLIPHLGRAGYATQRAASPGVPLRTLAEGPVTFSEVTSGFH